MQERASWLGKMMDHSDLLVAILVISIIMMMIIPMSPVVLDILLTFNISFALIILMVSMFNTDPLEFSIFPALLMVTNMFRL